MLPATANFTSFFPSKIYFGSIVHIKKNLLKIKIKKFLIHELNIEHTPLLWQIVCTNIPQYRTGTGTNIISKCFSNMLTLRHKVRLDIRGFNFLVLFYFLNPYWSYRNTRLLGNISMLFSCIIFFYLSNQFSTVQIEMLFGLGWLFHINLVFVL